ncbi:hypothetical protein ACFQ1S_14210 [Kibdelosporangium lantanae]|uniref:Uncharacterized protein n=1 Tax=Kibdelosporangium lantanae TaxID=1497396 RepID=A0ABW3MAE0_9PSEU
MPALPRSYRYVGPSDIRARVQPGGAGQRISCLADFERWAAAQPALDMADPFTFVIDTTGVLRLAPRRSEHVACAGGEPVLSAGEMTFGNESGRWTATEITNHSTGYCPDTSSWPAVAEALDRAGINHAGDFTQHVVFRRCHGCHELNIVREADFVCVFCDTDLPRRWNVDG